MGDPLLRKIVYISEENECKTCFHRSVCSFKEDRKEILKTLKETLDKGKDVPNSIFAFKFRCDEFHKNPYEDKRCL